MSQQHPASPFSSPTNDGVRGRAVEALRERGQQLLDVAEASLDAYGPDWSDDGEVIERLRDTVVALARLGRRDVAKGLIEWLSLRRLDLDPGLEGEGTDTCHSIDLMAVRLGHVLHTDDLGPTLLASRLHEGGALASAAVDALADAGTPGSLVALRSAVLDGELDLEVRERALDRIVDDRLSGPGATARIVEALEAASWPGRRRLQRRALERLGPSKERQHLAQQLVDAPSFGLRADGGFDIDAMVIAGMSDDGHLLFQLQSLARSALEHGAEARAEEEAGFAYAVEALQASTSPLRSQLLRELAEVAAGAPETSRYNLLRALATVGDRHALDDVPLLFDPFEEMGTKVHAAALEVYGAFGGDEAARAAIDASRLDRVFGPQVVLVWTAAVRALGACIGVAPQGARSTGWQPLSSEASTAAAGALVDALEHSSEAPRWEALEATTTLALADEDVRRELGAVARRMLHAWSTKAPTAFERETTMPPPKALAAAVLASTDDGEELLAGVLDAWTNEDLAAAAGEALSRRAGCTSVIERALAEHSGSMRPDHVVAMVESHGRATTSAALEAMLQRPTSARRTSRPAPSDGPVPPAAGEPAERERGGGEHDLRRPGRPSQGDGRRPGKQPRSRPRPEDGGGLRP